MKANKPRLGIPTASNFHYIITPLGKMVDSRERKKYIYKLVAERILQIEMPSSAASDWAERGIEMEEQAAQAFAKQMNVELVPAEFVTTDDGKCGCSPDRWLKGRNEIVEIKSPAPWTHIGYMIEDGPGEKYRPQIQGQLLVTEVDKGHFWSWHPDFAPVHIAVNREERFINTLRELLDRFNDELDAGEAWVRKHGCVGELVWGTFGERAA